MFRTEELVPPETFRAWGERSLWFLDSRAVDVLKELRKDYGPVVVNDWAFGGEIKYRGYRPPECKIGAVASQHRVGRAFDCLFKDADVSKVRIEVIAKARAGHEVYGMIRGIETDVSWFHFDVRNAPSLMVFRP
jgi:hypothetical protein